MSDLLVPTPRPLLAAFLTVTLTASLAGCSLLGAGTAADDAAAGPATPTPSASAGAPAGTGAPSAPGGAATGPMKAVQAAHLTVQVPAGWNPVPDEDPWKYIHEVPNDAGGVAARIAFMPGGEPMGAQESVDWFVGQIKGTGQTDDNFAPIPTLVTKENRANISYTYTSGKARYVAVVWGITDARGAPSLVQLSGMQKVVTPQFVAKIDRSLQLTGNWQG